MRLRVSKEANPYWGWAMLALVWLVLMLGFISGLIGWW